MFDKEEFDILMTADGVGQYTAACNMFWLNFFQVDTSVPYNEGQIKRLLDYFFEVAHLLPETRPKTFQSTGWMPTQRFPTKRSACD